MSHSGRASPPPGSLYSELSLSSQLTGLAAQLSGRKDDAFPEVPTLITGSSSPFEWGHLGKTADVSTPKIMRKPADLPPLRIERSEDNDGDNFQCKVLVLDSEETGWNATGKEESRSSETEAFHLNDRGSRSEEGPSSSRESGANAGSVWTGSHEESHLKESTQERSGGSKGRVGDELTMEEELAMADEMWRKNREVVLHMPYGRAQSPRANDPLLGHSFDASGRDVSHLMNRMMETAAGKDGEADDSSMNGSKERGVLATVMHFFDKMPQIRLKPTQRRLLIAGWLLIGLGIALFVLIHGILSANSDRKNNLAAQCERESDRLVDAFGAGVHQVESYRGLIETFFVRPSEPRMNQSDFAFYSNSTAFTRPFTNTIVFTPKVFQGERAAFEAVRGPILSLDGSSAPSATLYAPAMFSSADVAPHILMRDMFEDPNYASAAEAAVQAGRWALSPPHFISNSTRLGLTWASPFYQPNLPITSNTSEERMQALLGWLGAIINFHSTMAEMNSSVQDTRIHMFVYDVTNETEPLLLYQPPQYSLNSSSLTVSSRLGQVGFQLNFSDPARTFEMRCSSRGAAPFPWAAVEWALAVMAMCFLLALLMHGMLKRVSMVERDYERMERLKNEMAEAKAAAESADVLKSQFLATVSHEFRTPVNGVLGMLSLLRDTDLTTVQADYVETARSSGQALASLLSDVLDFSKIEAGRMDMEMRPFKIREVVDDVLNLFAENVRLKGIELAAIVQDAIPAIIVGDPARFRQVLVNLIGNATKFTDEGHVFVTVRAAEESEDLRTTHRPPPSPPGSAFSSFLYVKEETEERKQKSWGDAEEGFIGRKRKSGRVLRSESDDESSRRVGRQRDRSNTPPLISSNPIFRKSGWATMDGHIMGKFSTGNEAHHIFRSAPLAGPQTHQVTSVVEKQKAKSAGPSSPSSMGIGVDIDSWSSRGASTSLSSEKKMWSTLSGREAANEAHTPERMSSWLQKKAVHTETDDNLRSWLRLVVAVEDTGCGIPEEAQAEIFRPFSQLDGSTIRAHAGTGIGLTISHRLVELQGGSMGFVSKPMCGSTFFFDIKFQLANPDSPRSSRVMNSMAMIEDQRVVQGAKKLQGKRALIIDDSRVRGQVLASLLKQLGVHADIAPDTDHAILMAQTIAAQAKALQSMAAATNGSSDNLSRNHSVRDSEGLGSVSTSGSGAVTPSSSHSPAGSIWSTSWVTPITSPLISPTGSYSHSLSDDGQVKQISQGSWARYFLDAGELAVPTPPPLAASEAAQRYDVIFADTDSRVWKNRSEVFFEALRSYPALVGIPLILVLQKPPVSAEIAAKSVSYRTYLYKPLRRVKLISAMVEAVGVAAATEKFRPKTRETKQVNPLLVQLLKGLTFLVVDDNLINRKVASKMLGKYGVIAECVDGGAKAVEKMKEGHNFSMVLMDIQMPEMDGYEAAVRIRAQEKKADEEEPLKAPRHVPIIALTADVLSGTKEKCMESGMDAYLTKPIDEDHFYQTCLQFFNMPPS